MFLKLFNVLLTVIEAEDWEDFRRLRFSLAVFIESVMHIKIIKMYKKTYLNFITEFI